MALVSIDGRLMGLDKGKNRRLILERIAYRSTKSVIGTLFVKMQMYDTGQ